MKSRVNNLHQPAKQVGRAARMKQPLMVDGRNFLDPAAMRAAGFEYEGIGKPRATAAPAASE